MVNGYDFCSSYLVSGVMDRVSYVQCSTTGRGKSSNFPVNCRKLTSLTRQQITYTPYLSWDCCNCQTFLVQLLKWFTCICSAFVALITYNSSSTCVLGLLGCIQNLLNLSQLLMLMSKQSFWCWCQKGHRPRWRGWSTLANGPGPEADSKTAMHSRPLLCYRALLYCNTFQLCNIARLRLVW